MQSGRNVCIYAKSQPLFAKLTKLQTLFAKPLEGYFLLFFVNKTMQSLFAKSLKMLLVCWTQNAYDGRSLKTRMHMASECAHGL